MIKRKFIFSISLLVITLVLIISITGILDSLSANTAVSQLSDDIVINTLSRNMIVNNGYTKIITVIGALSIIGICFSFIPKHKDKDMYLKSSGKNVRQ